MRYTLAVRLAEHKLLVAPTRLANREETRSRLLLGLSLAILRDCHLYDTVPLRSCRPTLSDGAIPDAFHPQTALPIIEKLDPYQFFIAYKLFRDATKSINGQPVKVRIPPSASHTRS